jgi:pyruvate,water dikinase
MDPNQATLPSPLSEAPLLRPFEEVGIDAIAEVGGKHASLGEMIRELASQGVKVPGGFATTAAAYRLFLRRNDLEAPLRAILGNLDSGDLTALQQAGQRARELILGAALPPELANAVAAAYAGLGAGPVAVRSSATAEDLPDASFAGQQETYLNVRGEKDLLAACLRCYSSLFTDRAISYRQINGFDHLEVALSIGVQRMVRSDLGAAGVMFTIDTETGFRNAVLLNAAYGLGENVVQGAVNPDEILLFKPTLREGYAAIVSKRLGSKAIRMVYGEGGTVRNEPVPPPERGRYAISDEEALTLGRWACLIEEHYSARHGTATPMDIEWARDGESGELFILQARPETVESRRSGSVLCRWHLKPHQAELITHGRAIGASISSGRARVILNPSGIDRFEVGDLLVTERTDPDWEPILKKARGVITNQGGRTCHAAIIAREMGITAVVGCGDATESIKDGEAITISCAEGEDGMVYRGLLRYEKEEQKLEQLPPTRTRILMNVGNPEKAFRFTPVPCDVAGLTRMEFILAHHIRVHPMALVQP